MPGDRCRAYNCAASRPRTGAWCRDKGGLVDRWGSRWQSSIARHHTRVPSWSTPSLRFCTSAMKPHAISAMLKRRFPFPGQVVIDVTGIRRDESRKRAKSSMADLDTQSPYGFAQNPQHLCVPVREMAGRHRASPARSPAAGWPCLGKGESRTKERNRKQITPAMHYVRGWPTRMLTDDEADILASVRREITNLFGFGPQFHPRPLCAPPFRMGAP
jgi:hypothetical protein